jgi:hypothetical protein
MFRKTDAGALSKVYMEHREGTISDQKQKWNNNIGGQSQRLAISIDLGQLLSHMDSSDGDGVGGSADADKTL